MIRTPKGTETVSGPLGVILAYTSYSLVDIPAICRKTSRSVNSGFTVFDQYNLQVQIAAVERVTQSFFWDDVPPFPKIQVFDAASSAIFELMRHCILHGKIKTKLYGNKESQAFRDVLASAFLQRFPESFYRIPDNDRWELHSALVGVLASDFENENKDQSKWDLPDEFDLDKAIIDIKALCKKTIETERFASRNDSVIILWESILRREGFL